MLVLAFYIFRQLQKKEAGIPGLLNLKNELLFNKLFRYCTL